jgi:hypothetical protein
MLDSPCSTIGSAGETLHKWIHRWDAPSEITQCLRESPLTLIAYPQYGVDAMAERVFRGQAFQLSYAISDTFVASLEAKTYGSSPGRLAACFRAMAFIAAGRAGALTSLKAHAQHEKEGGGSRPLRDARGRTLYRGYLANNTPNAHRIVWWGGAKPEFVAVLGHDESPPI